MVSPAAQTACPLVRMDNNKTARERESQWSLCDCGATRTCSCPCGYRVHTRLDSIANKLHHLLLPALLPWIARRLLVSPAHHFETTPTFIRNGAWNLSFLSAFNPRYAVHSGASQARQASRVSPTPILSLFPRARPCKSGDRPYICTSPSSSIASQQGGSQVCMYACSRGSSAVNETFHPLKVQRSCSVDGAHYDSKKRSPRRYGKFQSLPFHCLSNGFFFI